MRSPRRSRHSASYTTLCIAVTTLTCAALAACNKTAGPQPSAAAVQQANDSFAAITAACTQFLAAREAHVGPISASEAKDSNTWAKTGYSPALVQPEVNATESPVTPFVGKIVIKDNEARATAATEAEAKAITLTQSHLLSNRTHTLVYSFDGTQWRWQNGQRLTKAPGQNDAMAALTLAEVSAPGPKGFAGCLPS
jgi:hypothetical protein